MTPVLSPSVPRLAAAFTWAVATSGAAFAQSATRTLSPGEVGARYGQALGVLEVCYGSKLTDAGKALGSNFAGAAQDEFKAAAAKTYDAWVKVRGCTNQRDPNTCKIIMDKSCLAAEAEIGPKGSEMPGLVEFIPHP